MSASVLFEQNFFQLFGLPTVFGVDLAVLEANHQKLVTQMHPDRFVSASEAERRIAEQFAGHVNHGLAVLADPVRRAKYCCERLGVKFNDAKPPQFPPAFLMQQMEWREQIEQWSTSISAEPPVEAMNALLVRVNKEFDSLLAEVEQGVNRGMSDEPDVTAVEAHGARWVGQLQFVDKARRQLKKLLEGNSDR